MDTLEKIGEFTFSEDDIHEVEPKPLVNEMNLTKWNTDLVDLPDIDFGNVMSMSPVPTTERVPKAFPMDLPDEIEILPLEKKSPPNKKSNGTHTPEMTVREVKYGMTVIANIGNFENIRTHIEATADVHGSDFTRCIYELGNHIRKVGRDEYRQIKEKQTRKHQ